MTRQPRHAGQCRMIRTILEVDFDCAKGGFVTGDARPAHSQGSELRAAPWVRRHSTHPAVIRRDVERRARVTLPGALSDRAARLGQLQVGGERDWPPGEVLYLDQS